MVDDERCRAIYSPNNQATLTPLTIPELGSEIHASQTVQLSGNELSLGEARGVAGMTTLAQRHPETRFVSDGATQARHSI